MCELKTCTTHLSEGDPSGTSDEHQRRRQCFSSLLPVAVSPSCRIPSQFAKDLRSETAPLQRNQRKSEQGEEEREKERSGKDEKVHSIRFDDDHTNCQSEAGGTRKEEIWEERTLQLMITHQDVPSFSSLVFHLPKVTHTTPLFFFTRSKTSSGTLRGWLWFWNPNARKDEGEERRDTQTVDRFAVTTWQRNRKWNRTSTKS